MEGGSIIFVHGTGVRLKDYKQNFSVARKRAIEAGIMQTLIECAWGDPLGINFNGLSLPGNRSEKQIEHEEADFARWSWLIADPLFELEQLTIRAPSSASALLPPPSQKPGWLCLWETISAYSPTQDLLALINRAGLIEYWCSAWFAIVQSSGVSKLAFERSAHELPEVCQALARALVAQLHVAAVADHLAGPNRELRNCLVNRLLSDWNQHVLAPSEFFGEMFKRAATRILRRHRNDFSDSAALPIGDILLYQTRGEQIRNFIRGKIDNAVKPITLVAHSLGGIACVDLLALPNPPEVARLITIGSQAPFLYEIGALTSLKFGQTLPDGFPRWLNIYDRNDFLSYVATPLFGSAVEDREVESGQPFPDSHSAYFSNDMVWQMIHNFNASENE